MTTSSGVAQRKRHAAPAAQPLLCWLRGAMNRRDLLPFDDRHEAGEELAGLLQQYAGRSDVIVLGLPRGGVPVAAVVAGALGAPLTLGRR